MDNRNVLTRADWTKNFEAYPQLWIEQPRLIATLPETEKTVLER